MLVSTEKVKRGSLLEERSIGTCRWPAERLPAQAIADLNEAPLTDRSFTWEKITDYEKVFKVRNAENINTPVKLATRVSDKVLLEFLLRVW